MKPCSLCPLLSVVGSGAGKQTGAASEVIWIPFFCGYSFDPTRPRRPLCLVGWADVKTQSLLLVTFPTLWSGLITLDPPLSAGFAVQRGARTGLDLQLRA